MTSEHHAGKNNPVLILALMVLIGGAVYLNSLTNGFHYDDGHHITGNPNIRSLQNIPRFFVDPGAFSIVPSTRLYEKIDCEAKDREEIK